MCIRDRSRDVENGSWEVKRAALQMMVQFMKDGVELPTSDALGIAFKGLTYSDSDVQNAAQVAFDEIQKLAGKISSEGIIEPIIQGMDSDNWKTRRAAIQFITQMKESGLELPPEDTVEAIVKGLLDSDSDVKEAAGKARDLMSQSGLDFSPAKFASAIAKFSSRETFKVSGDILSTVLEILNNNESIKPGEFLNLLMKGLVHPETNVRSIAVEIRKKFTAEHPLSPGLIMATITKAASDSDWRIRRAAFWFLSESVNEGIQLPAGDVTNLIFKGMMDSDSDVRNAATTSKQGLLNSKVSFSPSEAMPAIEKGLADDGWRVRREAIYMLTELIKGGSKFKAADVASLVIKGLLDSDSDVRDSAAAARQVAKDAGIKIGNVQIASAISGCLSDSQWKIRRAALNLMIEESKSGVQFPPSEVASAVIRGLADSDSDVRESARQVNEYFSASVPEHILIPHFLYHTFTGLSSENASSVENSLKGLVNHQYSIAQMITKIPTPLKSSQQFNIAFWQLLRVRLNGQVVIYNKQGLSIQVYEDGKLRVVDLSKFIDEPSQLIQMGYDSWKQGLRVLDDEVLIKKK
eukprot:TRINITY_DN5285_c0_g1_i3.p1 TRINITY_DN5285_c0_g1~~TRINITY_DN5285_c0_g1_i3.p1  ORF type:complete len:579 (+),score=142.88 TRINITY_DN5285_c0_g1_i3:65-1801(+)